MKNKNRNTTENCEAIRGNHNWWKGEKH